VRGSVRLLPAVSVATFASPFATPVEVGVKLKTAVALWVGLRVRGRVTPETANALPVTVSWVMVIAALPVLVTVTVFVAVVPTLTEPKFNELLLEESVPDVPPVPPELLDEAVTPEQPERTAKIAASIAIAANFLSVAT
jgi:hypothetical protein